MIKLAARKRDIGENLNALRKSGVIPSVFYGPKTDSVAITVYEKDFMNVWRKAGETTVFTLSVDNKENIDVLLHNVARDPITDAPVHIDFYVVDKTKKVTASVPIMFIGEAPAVKSKGGTLVKVLRELEIEGLPTDLPHNIEVDISSLVDVDSVVSIKDVALPSGIEAMGEPDEVVVSISVEKIDEDTASDATDFESIVVEKKGKKKEGEDSSDESENKQ